VKDLYRPSFSFMDRSPMNFFGLCWRPVFLCEIFSNEIFLDDRRLRNFPPFPVFRWMFSGSAPFCILARSPALPAATQPQDSGFCWPQRIPPLILGRSMLLSRWTFSPPRLRFRFRRRVRSRFSSHLVPLLKRAVDVPFLTLPIGNR